MSSQIELTVSLVMISVFVLAIVGFTIGFANDNDAEVNVLDDPEGRIEGLYTTTGEGIDTFKNEGESTYQSILDTTLEPGSDSPQSAAPFAVTPKNTISVFTSILTVPRDAIFGGRGSQFSFIFTSLITLIVFIFGLLLYKTLRGNP